MLCSFGIKLTISPEGLHETFWHRFNDPQNLTPSAVQNTIRLLKDANIYFSTKPITFKGSGTLYVDDSLKIYKKDYTNPTVFKKLFEEKLANIQPNTILYTDGSFSNNTTSYAIVKQEETFLNIKSARLPDHSGIFAAEISAIRNAIND